MPGFVMAELGAAQLHPRTRVPLIQAVNPGTDDENAEPFGELPAFGTLGVTSLPAPKTAAGSCEGFVVTDAAGLDGIIAGMRDLRTAGVTAELKGGETCLHSTGDGFESRVFCKDKIVAIIIGDDTAFILDKNTQTATLAIGGACLQIGANGILLAAPGGEYLQLSAGKAQLVASATLLGSGGLTGAGYFPCAVINPASPAVPLLSPGVMCSAPLP